MASVGAYYLLVKKDKDYGRIFIRTGIISGIIASLLVAFPSGDTQGKNVALHQPVTLAAMEGLFETKEGADLMIIGQPDMEKLRMDNPLYVPKMLSFLTYNRWNATVKGLDAYPRDQWPDNIPLLYYSYHIKIGLGTLFIAVMVMSLFLLWRKRLYTARWALWILLLSFPYIANTAGWMTAELGRQPFLVYGLIRTIHGVSPTVSAGNRLSRLSCLTRHVIRVAILSFQHAGASSLFLTHDPRAFRSLLPRYSISVALIFRSRETQAQDLMTFLRLTIGISAKSAEGFLSVYSNLQPHELSVGYRWPFALPPK